jgi:thioredoxin 1
MVTKVTDSNFDDEVINAEGPVLLVFMASWCPACQEYEPFVKKFAEVYGDFVKVCVVDVDESPDTKQYQGVYETPSTYLFLNGEEKRELAAGCWDFDQIVEFVEHVLELKL